MAGDCDLKFTWNLGPGIWGLGFGISRWALRAQGAAVSEPSTKLIAQRKQFLQEGTKVMEDVSGKAPCHACTRRGALQSPPNQPRSANYRNVVWHRSFFSTRS